MTAAIQTNMPWGAFRCDRIKRGQTPTGMVLVSGHVTPGEAMDECNRLRRDDTAHGYCVAAADYPVEA